MSISATDIEKMRTTLRRLKTDLIDDDELYDRTLFRDALQALSTIGKEHISQLKDEVYSVLECWHPILRSDAISTLAYDTRLDIKEFREQAYDIFLNDPDSDVKATALSAWSCNFYRTDNPKVLSILYKILKNESYDIAIRTEAFDGIFRLCKNRDPNYNPYTSSTPLLRSETHSEFNSKVNWDAIEDIMRKHAPEALKE